MTKEIKVELFGCFCPVRLGVKLTAFRKKNTMPAVKHGGGSVKVWCRLNRSLLLKSDSAKNGEPKFLHSDVKVLGGEVLFSQGHVGLGSLFSLINPIKGLDLTIPDKALLQMESLEGWLL